MSTYAIQIRNRETGEWDTTHEGESKSRRAFMQEHGQRKRTRNEYGTYYLSALAGVVMDCVQRKLQWRCVMTS